MALIIQCRSCRRRIPPGQISCQACGASDQVFIIDYWPRGRNGRRIRLALPTAVKTEAQARETEKAVLRANRERRSQPKPVVQKTNVADLFPDYLTWYHLHRKPSTWKDLSGVWENSLKGTFGELDVQEISEGHYSMYQQLRSITVSNRTINKELDYFSGFRTWCRREKKIPLDRIDYEELPYNKPLPIILSFDEIDGLIKAAAKQPLYHALFSLLYSTGARITSVATLKVMDFDFENLAVRIQVKGGYWKLLPIGEELGQEIKGLIEAKDLKPEAYVFSARKNGEPLKNVRPALRRIAAAAGIKKRIHPHLLRHSLATHMLAAGIDLRTVQEMLGHGNVTTTEIYTHIDISHLREAQRKTMIHGEQ